MQQSHLASLPLCFLTLPDVSATSVHHPVTQHPNAFFAETVRNTLPSVFQPAQPPKAAKSAFQSFVLSPSHKLIPTFPWPTPRAGHTRIASCHVLDEFIKSDAVFAAVCGANSLAEALYWPGQSVGRVCVRHFGGAGTV